MPSGAEEIERSRLEIAFRTGFSFPVGDTGSGTSLHDAVRNEVPLRVELGPRLGPSLYLTAFFEYDVASAPQCQDVTCSAEGLRFGGGIRYLLTDSRSIEPWFGLGLSYELLKQSSLPPGPGADLFIDHRSGVLLDLHFGIDFAVFGQTLKIGPWVGVSAGLFFDRTSGIPDQVLSSETVSGFHAWLSAGVRVALGF